MEFGFVWNAPSLILGTATNPGQIVKHEDRFNAVHYLFILLSQTWLDSYQMSTSISSLCHYNPGETHLLQLP